MTLIIDLTENELAKLEEITKTSFYGAEIDSEVSDAINKLIESQPCEDCISREAVLDVINFEDEWLFDAKSHNADTKIAFSGLKSRVKDLPSVTSKALEQQPSDVCISKEKMIKVIERMEKLEEDLYRTEGAESSFATLCLCIEWIKEALE